jgi:hypothetical protein
MTLDRCRIHSQNVTRIAQSGTRGVCHRLSETVADAKLEG